MRALGILFSMCFFISCNQSGIEYKKANTDQSIDKTIDPSTILDTVYNFDYAQVRISSPILENIDFSLGISRRNKDCIEIGNVFVKEEDLINNSIIYRDINNAIIQYLNNQDMMPHDFDRQYSKQTIQTIDKRIKICDYAILSTRFNMDENDNIYLESLKYQYSTDDEPNNFRHKNLRKWNERFQDVEIVLFPIENYREMLKKVLYVKYGSGSTAQLETWYNILKIRYSLFLKEGYSTYIEELHRRMSVQ